MTQTMALNLSITVDELTRFCEKLLKRSRDISKTHDALSTLEAFITSFSQSSNHPDALESIQQILASYTEQTRKQLLQQKTGDLIKGLIKLDCSIITSTHKNLSRNGFYQILETATSQIENDRLQTIKNWCNQWLDQATQKAEQASGCPDAYDFKSAGIDINEYQAIKDVTHFINSIC